MTAVVRARWLSIATLAGLTLAPALTPARAEMIQAIYTSPLAQEYPAPVGNSDPLDYSVGIGKILDPVIHLGPYGPPTWHGDYAVHSHTYVAPYVPDPAVAWVLYQYDVPVVVTRLNVIEHSNGVTQVEGFAGNSPGSLTSIGSVFGPLGDVTGNGEPCFDGVLRSGCVFYEGQPYSFEFNNTSVAGTDFMFIARKTSLPDGFALYRGGPNFPLESVVLPVPVPEPASTALFGTAFALALLFRRKFFP